MKTTMFLCFLIVTLDCSAQSVADAARKERQRQKQVQSTLIYSNAGADKKAVVPAPPAPVPAASTPAPAKPAAPSAPAAPVHDEKYWRETFQKARENTKRADDKVRVLELKINQLNMELLNRTDIYNREYRVGPEIGKTQAELDAARKEAAQTNQKIADLEEELRRSGNPPGWAR